MGIKPIQIPLTQIKNLPAHLRSPVDSLLLEIDEKGKPDQWLNIDDLKSYPLPQVLLSAANRYQKNWNPYNEDQTRKNLEEFYASVQMIDHFQDFFLNTDKQKLRKKQDKPEKAITQFQFSYRLMDPQDSSQFHLTDYHGGSIGISWRNPTSWEKLFTGLNLNLLVGSYRVKSDNLKLSQNLEIGAQTLFSLGFEVIDYQHVSLGIELATGVGALIHIINSTPKGEDLKNNCENVPQDEIFYRNGKPVNIKDLLIDGQRVNPGKISVNSDGEIVYDGEVVTHEDLRGQNGDGNIYISDAAKKSARCRLNEFTPIPQLEFVIQGGIHLLVLDAVRIGADIQYANRSLGKESSHYSWIIQDDPLWSILFTSGISF